MIDAEKRVQWIYSSSNNKELQERYDQWAADYDKDLKDEFGWIGPESTVEFFSKYVPCEAKVLDAGAGTGLVGMVLNKKGYGNITAMDMSNGMLDQARGKKVYNDYKLGILGETLDFESNSFGGIISVGVFTLGHAPASGFEELVRLAKPGAHIVFTLRPDVYEEKGFREKFLELEEAKLWEKVEVSEPFKTLPVGEPEVMMQVWVFKAL